MNELDCKQIEDLLVAYSDGELENELEVRVAAHLERCSECRAQLGRLEASLSLASDVWRESARGVADVEATPARLDRSTPRRAILVLASTAAALLIGLAVWQHITEERTPLAGGGESRGEVPEDKLARTEDRDTPKDEIRNSEDLLALIDRVGRRARLQVSLELLEQTPSLRPYAEQAERYLATAYGDLDVGETLDVNHSPKTREKE